MMCLYEVRIGNEFGRMSTETPDLEEAYRLFRSSCELAELEGSQVELIASCCGENEVIDWFGFED